MVKPVQSNSIRYKQGIVIEFLVVKNDIVVDIYKRVSTVCKNCAVDRSTTRLTVRIKVSASRETELHDMLRFGHPATANRPDMQNRADVVIRSDM